MMASDHPQSTSKKQDSLLIRDALRFREIARHRDKKVV